MESDAAINEDFNLSTPSAPPCWSLAREIWKKLNGQDQPFRYVSDSPFEHDVQHRRGRTSARPPRSARLRGDDLALRDA